MITLGKRGHAARPPPRRGVRAAHDASCKKLFDEHRAALRDRAGGYTRVVKLGIRARRRGPGVAGRAGRPPRHRATTGKKKKAPAPQGRQDRGAPETGRGRLSCTSVRGRGAPSSALRVLGVGAPRSRRVPRASRRARQRLRSRAHDDAPRPRRTLQWGAARVAVGCGAPGPRLLDAVRQATRARHLSRRTEEAYVGWVRRYVLFHGRRHPRDLSAADVGRFLTWLATEGRVSASTQNQALAALLFLYRAVLGADLPWVDGVVRAKVSRRLPVVLTRGEVRAVLDELGERPASSRCSCTVRGSACSRPCACG